MNKKIIILGAAGQLGSALVGDLSGSNEVIPLTRKDFEAGVDELDELFEDYDELESFDYLINCIAFHKVDQCESDFEQSMRINQDFVAELGSICLEKKAVFIHFSTDYVFNGKKREPYHESDQPEPINVYGRSKLAGENSISTMMTKYFIFRVSSLFGPNLKSDRNPNFIDKMITAARENQKLRVIENQIMSPTYTVDAAAAVKHFIDRGIDDYGLYHLCNGGETNWYDYAKKIFELSGYETDLTPCSYEEFHTVAPRPQFCSLDNSALAKYYKMPEWENALMRYIGTEKI